MSRAPAERLNFIFFQDICSGRRWRKKKTRMISRRLFRAIFVCLFLSMLPGAGWGGPARYDIRGESAYRTDQQGGSGAGRNAAAHAARMSAWMLMGREISLFHDVQMLKLDAKQLACIAAASVQPEISEKAGADGKVMVAAVIKDSPRQVALTALRFKEERSVIDELSRGWKRGEDALSPGRDNKGWEKHSMEEAGRKVESVNEYFRGWSLLIAGDYREAHAVFSRAVAIDPENAQALCQRGFLSYLDGDSERAINDFDEAIRLEGNYADAYYCRGLVHVREKRYAQAIVEFDWALHWNPKHPYAAECRKGAFEKARHWVPDLAWFEKTAKAKPKIGSARLGLGTALAALGRHREAVTQYNSALKIEPLDVRVYIARGKSYASLGNFRRAITDYDRAIELNPRLAESYFLRGAAYLESGDCRRAIVDLDRALEFDPAYSEAANRRALAYSRLGKPKPDLAYLDAAVSRNPEHARNYLLRGSALWESGKPKEAAEDFTRVIERLEYEDPGAYLMRAAAYAGSGQTARAVSDQEKLIEIAPDEYIQFGSILNRIPHDAADKVRSAFISGSRSKAENEADFIFRGTCRIVVQDYDKAVSDFRRAVALNPKSRRGYLFMGVAHAILGNHELAALNYGKALNADSGYALAYFARSIALRNINRKRESLSDLKEASRLGLTAAAEALEEQGYKR